MPSSTYKRITPTSTLEERLERYNRRVNQLKTRRERIAAKIKFYENNMELLIQEQSSRAAGRSATEKRLKRELESFKESVARLDFLILRNEGGTITQEMIDYDFPNRFGYTNEAENRDYVAGDVFVPNKNDRFNLIKNVTEELEDRKDNEELRQIAQVDNTPNPLFPQVTVTNPNDGSTMTVDKADYYGGTLNPYTSDNDIQINSLLEKLKIQETALQRNDAKINLTRTLQIEPRMSLPNGESTK